MTDLQQTALNILLDIDRVCRENGIFYMLAYGTLIGAVRHKGFIPWDDDVDIVMTRENYNKFVGIANEKLSPKYKLSTCYSNQTFMYNFAKVEDVDTSFIEKLTLNSCALFGVYVDIFPLDKVENDKEKITKIWYKQRRLQSLIYSHYTKNNTSSNLFHKICKTIITKIDVTFLHKMLDKMISSITKEDKYYFVFTNAYKYYVYSKDDLRTQLCNFEGHMLPISVNYDVILSALYGDYMKLPPEEERQTHQPFYCDLNRRISKEELKEMILKRER